jgi:hypothetical protein
MAGVCILVVMVSACSDGDATGMAEYARKVEDLVTTMNRSLDMLDAEAAREVTIESEQRRWTERSRVRRTFLDALEALEPPSEAVDLHGTAVLIIEDLTRAEEALAERAASIETMDELLGMEDSPEYRAFLAVDERAVAICRSALAELATPEQAMELEMPWVPTEMQEVVSVWFGCTVEERG